MWRFFFGLPGLLVCHLALAASIQAEPKTVAETQTLTISVDSAAQRASDIVVRKVEPITFLPSRPAYGVALDPAQLIALRNQIVAAQASRRLTAQSLARARLLYRSNHNIAMAMVQSAEAHYATADARETALAAKARIDWGARLGSATIKGGPMIRTLSDGKSSLIEAAVTGQALNPPESALAHLPSGGSVTLRLIGAASHMPAGLIGQAFYYLGPADVPVGLPLSLNLTEAPKRTGVAVPASAILYLQGQKFIFREVTANRFAMVRISDVMPMHRSGQPLWDFVGKDLKPGDWLVVKGAGVLLSATHAAPASRTKD